MGTHLSTMTSDGVGVGTNFPSGSGSAQATTSLPGTAYATQHHPVNVHPSAIPTTDSKNEFYRNLPQVDNLAQPNYSHPRTWKPNHGYQKDIADGSAKNWKVPVVSSDVERPMPS